ncbi:24405_t:CDS:2, partial [Racocetra persica]
MPHNESISNFKDLSNFEFGESTHSLESDEPIYDLEFNRPIWEEASDTLKLYSQYEGFKLRKGRVEKTSNGTIRKRTMLCEHSGKYKSKNIQLTKETSTKYIKCLWHVNLSQPQKNNPNGNVYITTLDNSYNYDLSPYRTKFLMIDMLNDTASLYEELVRRKNEDPR